MANAITAVPAFLSNPIGTVAGYFGGKYGGEAVDSAVNYFSDGKYQNWYDMATKGWDWNSTAASLTNPG